jgi:hypothetical protein
MYEMSGKGSHLAAGSFHFFVTLQAVAKPKQVPEMGGKRMQKAF